MTNQQRSLAVPKIILVVIIILLMQGCVNVTATKPEPNESESIVDTINQYYEASQLGLISPYRLYDPSGKNPGITKDGAYRTIRRWWCMDGHSSQSELLTLVSEHCQINGGIYSNNWCSQRETEDPLYKVVIGDPRVVGADTSTPCRAGDNIGVLGHEKAPEATEKQWMTIARLALDYESPSELLQRENSEKALRIEAQRIAMEQQQDLARAVLSSPQGTRICKDFDEGKSVYVGFIEARSEGKIRITVSQAVRKRDPRYQLDNFQSSTVWDYPQGWYVCE